MRETKIYCDHRQKQINPMKDYAEVEISVAHKYTEADLCTGCLNALDRIVAEFCRKKNGEEEE